MAVSWTSEQQQVIRQRGTNLLVSAAAGSGKTAVLVERILTMVTDPVHPVDIDRLLVVTFTRAAAGEMRERIGRALEEKLVEDPDNEHLQRQGVLLGHAQISTIHGFCTHVIQNYFHRIGIDPGYRIAEEGELKLLRGAVIGDLLEEEYAAGSPAFSAFMDAYSPGQSDRRAEELIQRIYDFAISDPDPALWLERCVGACRITTPEDLTASPWMQGILTEARLRIAYAADLAEQCLERAAESDGPTDGIPVFTADLEMIQNLMSLTTYSELCDGLEKPNYVRWTAAKNKPATEDPAVRDQLKKMRETYKKTLKTLKETYFAVSEERVLEELAGIRPHMEELVRLVRLFHERFGENKRKKNIVDFSDLEHYALQILLEKQEDGSYVRTAAARELAEQYAEVMIDEYQDSNFIQEALLSAVSGNAEGRYDRFMVGDMKQSIYSFRMARPELFLEKYSTYQPWRENGTTEPASGAEASDGSKSDSPNDPADDMANDLAKNPADGLTKDALTDAADGTSVRIGLSRNFRSRREVLEVCNAFFSRLMIPEIGGIRYDADQALYTGASYPEGPDPDFPRAELLLVDPSDDAWGGDGSRSAMLEAEALTVADRIRSLHAAGQIWDGKAGAFRPVQYRDCVVLLRSAAGLADVFVRTLRDEGIPAFAASRAGYFSTVEVVTVLNYLRILDNPRQDIPFTAILRSPIAGCTDEELAKIRIAYPDMEMYRAALCYKDTDDVTGWKLAAFFAQLADLRSRVPCTATHELIRMVLEETGYGSYAAAMPAGAQREANLRMLVEKAVDYENTSYHGLFNFVRYIEKLEKYEVDFGEVNLFGEGEDAVRVMTIHKSKGLEFPIVFVSGLGKQFNMADQRSAIPMHAGLGIGMDVVDLEHRTKSPSLLKRAIAGAIRRDACGEELRVLYVAMTRAKEKLILTGIVKDTERVEQALADQDAAKALADRTPDGQAPVRKPLDYGSLIGAKSCLDWILQAVPEPELLTIRVARPETLAGGIADDAVRTRVIVDALEQAVLSPADTAVQTAEEMQALDRFLEEKAAFVYPYAEENALPAKLTVSEIKKASMEAMQEEKGVELYPQEEIIPYVPAFMREAGQEQAAGAARGTVYHHVLECLNYRAAAEHLADLPKDDADKNAGGTGHPKTTASLCAEVERQIGSMVSRGILSREDASCVRPEDIAAFLASPIGRRMATAALSGRLRREQPFVIDIAAKDIDRSWPEDENILVQGTIDAYFEEDGQYVLVDYKTDRVFSADGSDLVKKYQKQLEFYRLALERIAGIPVKEMYIYSVTLGKQIPVAG